MHHLKPISLMILALFIFTSCLMDFGNINIPADEEITSEENRHYSNEDISEVERTFHRLSFNFPDNFTVTERDDFLQLLTPTLVVIFTHDYAAGTRDSLGDGLRSMFLGMGYEQISPELGLFSLVHIDYRRWGSITMENPDFPGQLHMVYFFASGGEHYVIRFVVLERNLESIKPIIDGILDSIVFDDSHHRAQLSGTWLGYPDNSIMIFDSDSFYWFLEETRCMYNVKIGTFRTTKGVLIGDTYYPDGFAVDLYYEYMFIVGHQVDSDILNATSFIFTPFPGTEETFLVTNEMGGMFLFERIE